MNLNNGSLRYFGNGGRNWSDITKSYASPTSATTYSLVFHPSTDKSSVNTSNTAHRWSAFPVRCLDILVSRVLSYLEC